MATTDNVKRISTGIPGLDKLMGGGIVEGSSVLLNGGPGTGKTIFGLQFLADGVKNGEKCCYVTLEEPVEKVKLQGRQVNVPVDKIEFVSAKELKYEAGLGKKPQTKDERVKLVTEILAKGGFKRIIVDPMNTLVSDGDSDERDLRRFLVDRLNAIGSTNMLIGEATEGGYTDKVMPCIVDGIIMFGKEVVGNNEQRTLVIDKMRLTKIVGGRRSFTIESGKGIVLGD